MGVNFRYNDHIVEYMRRLRLEDSEFDPLFNIHQRCIIWLAENYQIGRDYRYSGETPMKSAQKGKPAIVQELIWFCDEEHLLAFRLATGI